jgi:transcriptional/translational regulatory protein YebC/TACO1
MAAPDRPDLNHRLALTVREAAALLGVGRDAIYNAIKPGRGTSRPDEAELRRGEFCYSGGVQGEPYVMKKRSGASA